MNEICAREELRIWSRTEAPEDVKEYRTKQEAKKPERRRITDRMAMEIRAERFGKRYGILLIAAAVFTLYTIILSGCVEANTEKRLRKEMALEYSARLEAYKQEQAREKQAEYFLSGEASREAFLNQEIDAAARLAAKMGSDVQKGGIICNALARVMSESYPDTMRAVVEQPEQWMFYDAGNKFTEHDREMAEKILRDYYEKGIVPNGLSEEFVYGSWSASDYVLRNTWDFSGSTRTWRYQG